MEFITTVKKGTINEEDLICLFQYIGYTEFDWISNITAPADVERKDDDCREDVWARTLLSGKALTADITDPDKDDEGEYSKHITITLKDIEDGITYFAKDCPNSFSDLVKDDADLWTYCNWLQCVVYHEAVFG